MNSLSTGVQSVAAVENLIRASNEEEESQSEAVFSKDLAELCCYTLMASISQTEI